MEKNFHDRIVYTARRLFDKTISFGTVRSNKPALTSGERTSKLNVVIAKTSICRTIEMHVFISNETKLITFRSLAAPAVNRVDLQGRLFLLEHYPITCDDESSRIPFMLKMDDCLPVVKVGDYFHLAGFHRNAPLTLILIICFGFKSNNKLMHSINGNIVELEFDGKFHGLPKVSASFTERDRNEFLRGSRKHIHDKRKLSMYCHSYGFVLTKYSRKIIGFATFDWLVFTVVYFNLLMFYYKNTTITSVYDCLLALLNHLLSALIVRYFSKNFVIDKYIYRILIMSVIALICYDTIKSAMVTVFSSFYDIPSHHLIYMTDRVLTKPLYFIHIFAMMQREHRENPVIGISNNLKYYILISYTIFPIFFLFHFNVLSDGIAIFQKSDLERIITCVVISFWYVYRYNYILNKLGSITFFNLIFINSILNLLIFMFFNQINETTDIVKDILYKSVGRDVTLIFDVTTLCSILELFLMILINDYKKDKNFKIFYYLFRLSYFLVYAIILLGILIIINDKYIPTGCAEHFHCLPRDTAPFLYSGCWYFGHYTNSEHRANLLIVHPDHCQTEACAYTTLFLDWYKTATQEERKLKYKTFKFSNQGEYELSDVYVICVIIISCLLTIFIRSFRRRIVGAYLFNIVEIDGTDGLCIFRLVSRVKNITVPECQSIFNKYLKNHVGKSKWKDIINDNGQLYYTAMWYFVDCFDLKLYCYNRGRKLGCLIKGSGKFLTEVRCILTQGHDFHVDLLEATKFGTINLDFTQRCKFKDYDIAISSDFFSTTFINTVLQVIEDSVVVNTNNVENDNERPNSPKSSVQCNSKQSTLINSRFDSSQPSCHHNFNDFSQLTGVNLFQQPKVGMQDDSTESSQSTVDDTEESDTTIQHEDEIDIVFQEPKIYVNSLINAVEIVDKMNQYEFAPTNHKYALIFDPSFSSSLLTSEVKNKFLSECTNNHWGSNEFYNFNYNVIKHLSQPLILEDCSRDRIIKFRSLIGLGTFSFCQRLLSMFSIILIIINIVVEVLILNSSYYSLWSMSINILFGSLIIFMAMDRLNNTNFFNVVDNTMEMQRFIGLHSKRAQDLDEVTSFISIIYKLYGAFYLINKYLLIGRLTFVISSWHLIILIIITIEFVTVVVGLQSLEKLFNRYVDINLNEIYRIIVNRVLVSGVASAILRIYYNLLPKNPSLNQKQLAFSSTMKLIKVYTVVDPSIIQLAQSLINVLDEVDINNINTIKFEYDKLIIGASCDVSFNYSYSKFSRAKQLFNYTIRDSATIQVIRNSLSKPIRYLKCLNYVSSILPFGLYDVKYKVYDTNIDNVEAALVNRVLFVEPEPDGELIKHWLILENTFDKFSRIILRHHIPIMDNRSEFINSKYMGRKRDDYNQALNTLFDSDININDLNIKLFIKDEVIKPSLVEKPRLIMPRCSRYVVKMLIMKNFEEFVMLHLRLNKFDKYPQCAKSHTLSKRASILRKKWYSLSDPVVVNLDCTSFDAHVNKDMLRLEFGVYERYLQQCLGPLSSQYTKWFRHQIKNKMYYNGKDGMIKVVTNGVRTSGDWNTALGNVMVFMCMINAAMKILDVHVSNYRVYDDGDDCVLFVERADITKLNRLQDVFKNFGHNLKMDIGEGISSVEFCQCKFKEVNGIWRVYRDPRRFFNRLRYQITDSDVRDKIINQSIGDCNMYYGNPVIFEFSQRLASFSNYIYIPPTDVYKYELWTRIKPLTKQEIIAAKVDSYDDLAMLELYQIDGEELSLMKNEVKLLADFIGKKHYVIGHSRRSKCRLGLIVLLLFLIGYFTMRLRVNSDEQSSSQCDQEWEENKPLSYCEQSFSTKLDTCSYLCHVIKLATEKTIISNKLNTNQNRSSSSEKYNITTNEYVDNNVNIVKSKPIIPGSSRKFNKFKFSYLEQKLINCVCLLFHQLNVIVPDYDYYDLELLNQLSVDINALIYITDGNLGIVTDNNDYQRCYTIYCNQTWTHALKIDINPPPQLINLYKGEIMLRGDVKVEINDKVKSEPKIRRKRIKKEIVKSEERDLKKSIQQLVVEKKKENYAAKKNSNKDFKNKLKESKHFAIVSETKRKFNLKLNPIGRNLVGQMLLPYNVLSSRLCRLPDGMAGPTAIHKAWSNVTIQPVDYGTSFASTFLSIIHTGLSECQYMNNTNILPGATFIIADLDNTQHPESLEDVMVSALTTSSQLGNVFEVSSTGTASINSVIPLRTGFAHVGDRYYMLAPSIAIDNNLTNAPVNLAMNSTSNGTSFPLTSTGVSGVTNNDVIFVAYTMSNVGSGTITCTTTVSVGYGNNVATVTLGSFTVGAGETRNQSWAEVDALATSASLTNIDRFSGLSFTISNSVASVSVVTVTKIRVSIMTCGREYNVFESTTPVICPMSAYIGYPMVNLDIFKGFVQEERTISSSMLITDSTNMFTQAGFVYAAIASSATPPTEAGLYSLNAVGEYTGAYVDKEKTGLYMAPFRISTVKSREFHRLNQGWTGIQPYSLMTMQVPKGQTQFSLRIQVCDVIEYKVAQNQIVAVGEVKRDEETIEFLSKMSSYMNGGTNGLLSANEFHFNDIFNFFKRAVGVVKPYIPIVQEAAKISGNQYAIGAANVLGSISGQ